MFKLTDDEKQSLWDLIQTPGYAVLKRILDEVTADFARGVLNSPLRGSDDERKLFFTKAQYEGVKSFHFTLNQIIKDLKTQES